MKELTEEIKECQKKLREIEAVLDLPAKKKKIEELEKKAGEANFWEDAPAAGKIMREIEDLKKEIEMMEKTKKELLDLEDLAKLSEGEKEEKELEKEFRKIKKIVSQLELKTFFSGKYDRSNAIISIMSGAGGVDAQDWSEMIMRMYLRWAEKNNFKAKIMDETKGQEAGIKNATLEVIGANAYGYLKGEAGVHRLVRLSPFNSDNLRQTSFSLVEVMPVIKDVKEIKINPKDIKVDTFRSSGAGGQSVNTTDSAVRITHLPSKTVVTCQNERSQLQNREQAMKILRAKLHKKREEEEKKEKSNLRGESISAEWGSQIRSYVIHPYKMVKDHRTKYESKNPEAVLQGEIKDFMESYLKSFHK